MPWLRFHFLLWVSFFLLAMIAGDWLQAADITRQATDFNRFQLDDPVKADMVRKAGNLSGTADLTADMAHRPQVKGWFAYDFTLPDAGWYALTVQPQANGHEFAFDDKQILYGDSGPKIGQVWLEAGAHVLKITRTHWAGFGPISQWTLIPCGTGAPERISLAPPSQLVLRKGETLNLTLQFGPLIAPAHLVIIGQKLASSETVPLLDTTLPVTTDHRSQTLSLPCTEAGSYALSTQMDGRAMPPGYLQKISYCVVETDPPARSADETVRTLVAEIDCVKQAPDYTGGGDTQVITKSWGSYRQSGDKGFLQHENGKDPSWFAYKLPTLEPQKPYWIEFDYPDDQKRTFLAVLYDIVKGATAYRPATGPDCGGQFSLSHQMKTMGMYFWPQATDDRIMAITAQDGLSAALAKVRVYRLASDPLPMPQPNPGGRDYVQWYEEGDNFMSFFGEDSNRSAAGYLTASDRWAATAAHVGTTMLMPTVAVYQMGCYPTSYNVEYGNSYNNLTTLDLVRILELNCERYGLKFVGEFHPEARELTYPAALGTDANAFSQIDRHGNVRQKLDDPKYNFLVPQVEQFVLGMIGEYVDRYGDSSAFAGASLRQMLWQNTGFGNFGSLDWGYGDFTIHLFEKETGVQIPVDDAAPDRCAKRYDWLMANARDRWIAWRCEKSTAFFVKLRDRLRLHNKNATLYLNCFLHPNEASAREWQGFADFPREAGIDSAALSKIDGISLINATIPYGRRETVEADQRVRDAELRPDWLSLFAPAGTPGQFLFGAGYFEATDQVAAPQQLGYPDDTKAGWISGVINPAGRHYLERFALATAGSDAILLGDGGNAYAVGQPPLREFLAAYRNLPAAPFSLRKDAGDPVAVWQRSDKNRFYFYSVNRERYPVTVNFTLAGSGNVQDLADATRVETKDNVLSVKLEPYGLRAFSSPAAVQISQVAEIIPDEDLQQVRQMTTWLSQLADDVNQGKTGGDLSPDDKAELNAAATEAAKCLREGGYWRARTLQEAQSLRTIYAKCGRIPALLDQTGPLNVSAPAIAGQKLLALFKNPDAALIDSHSVARDWVGQQLVMTKTKNLMGTIPVPVSAMYDFEAGYVSGTGFPAAKLAFANPDGGTFPMPAYDGVPAARLFRAPRMALHRGSQDVSFSAEGGTLGLLYLECEPIYRDIPSNKWMVAGPFALIKDPGQDDAVAEMEAAMRDRHFAPEQKRDFAAPVPNPDGAPLAWRKPEGNESYLDLNKLDQKEFGYVSYAVTTIVSPEDRDAVLCYSADYWYKLWLNGQMVKDLDHPDGAPRQGQFTLPVRLRKGENELMIAVAGGTGGSGFWMAITDPNDLKYLQPATPPVTGAL